MNRHTTASLLVLLAIAFVAACGVSPQNQAHGSATYVKPASQGGQSVPPQQSGSDMNVTVAIDGTGTFAPIQSAACSLTNGTFSESATSSGQISSDGTYVSTFGSESATSTGTGTSAICGTLQNAKFTSVTSMTVQATIPANSTNCQGYCSAMASSQCQGSVDPGCMSSASGTCSAQCQSASKITGSGSLQSSDMAALNSQLASSPGDVDAKVDIVFTATE
jgi:hypothetical protein